MADKPIRVQLYQSSNPYEDTYHNAYVFDDKIDVFEETSEHAPGDRYGLMHEVKGPDFEVFKAALATDGEQLASAVSHRFSGSNGIHQLKDFCTQHGIQIKTYLV